MKLHTYLNFAGNTEEAFKFYKSALGGKLKKPIRFKDMPMEGITVAKKDENKIMHIGLEVEKGHWLMGTDTLESMGQKLNQGNNVYINIEPGSRKEADRIFKSLSSGGKVEMPMGDQVWGDYFGSFIDKFGVGWMVNYADPKKAARKK